PSDSMFAHLESSPRGRLSASPPHSVAGLFHVFLRVVDTSTSGGRLAPRPSGQPHAILNKFDAALFENVQHAVDGRHGAGDYLPTGGRNLQGVPRLRGSRSGPLSFCGEVAFQRIKRIPHTDSANPSVKPAAAAKT